MAKRAQDFDVRLAPGDLGERLYVVSEGDASNIVFASSDRRECEAYVEDHVDAFVPPEKSDASENASDKG